MEADWDFYQTASTDQAKARLAARKKQITDALFNVFTQILGAEKAKNFDFLTDSSFVPGSNDGMDFLLDNINVDTSKLEVALKKDSTKRIALSTNNTATVTPIAQTDVSSNTVKLVKRNLTEFAGIYTGTAKFTSYHSDGTTSVAEQIKSGSVTFNSNGTINATLGTSLWTGTYKLNDAGYSVKISGKISPTDGSSGGGTFVGSVDNDFNLSISYNTQAGGVKPDGSPLTAPPIPPAVVLLLTDGQNTEGPDPQTAASDARTSGIPVFTIGMGGRGNPFGGGNRGNGVDETLLQEIAAQTGGQYYFAPGAGELNRIYGDLGRALGWDWERYDIGQYFAIASLVTLTLASILASWWLDRSPRPGQATPFGAGAR
ncbi:MAG: VWA domain-containing protein [Chloroflexi bacterium]|nr:VWA domain-containing protein [Chloroflexota bacterium]